MKAVAHHKAVDLIRKREARTRRDLAADGAQLHGRDAENFCLGQHFVGVNWSDGDHHAALGFAEEQGVQTHVGNAGQINFRADQVRRFAGDLL